MAARRYAPLREVCEEQDDGGCARSTHTLECVTDIRHPLDIALIDLPSDRHHRRVTVVVRKNAEGRKHSLAADASRRMAAVRQPATHCQHEQSQCPQNSHPSILISLSLSTRGKRKPRCDPDP
eukprot:GHVU01091767.1.p1 GENE.GHVU01091767.1~~GHVU01091767.1.p1  ORF type:complete len:123 (+),score=4.87 GHVU01091767.1:235-603(+)